MKSCKVSMRPKRSLSKKGADMNQTWDRSTVAEYL